MPSGATSAPTAGIAWCWGIDGSLSRHAFAREVEAATVGRSDRTSRTCVTALKHLRCVLVCRRGRRSQGSHYKRAQEENCKKPRGQRVGRTNYGRNQNGSSLSSKSQQRFLKCLSRAGPLFGAFLLCPSATNPTAPKASTAFPHLHTIRAQEDISSNVEEQAFFCP